jgi:hypothetical protein
MLTQQQIQEILTADEFSVNQFASKFSVPVREIQSVLEERDNEVRLQHKMDERGSPNEKPDVKQNT